MNQEKIIIEVSLDGVHWISETPVIPIRFQWRRVRNLETGVTTTVKMHDDE